MEKIQCLQLSIDQYSFYGFSFDPEIFYHFRDLQISEISYLAYGFKKMEEDDEYVKYKRDYHIDVLNSERIIEMNIQTSFDLVDPFENDGATFIHEVHMSFTNGLQVKYYQGTLEYQIDDRSSFFKYTDILLKQYGVTPEKIYELTRLYPDCELYCERPDIFEARPNQ